MTIVATLGLSTMIQVTPANLGVYEATVFFVYRSFDIPAANALAAAVLQHFSVLMPSLGIGYLLILYRLFIAGASTDPRGRIEIRASSVAWSITGRTAREGGGGALG